MGFFTYIGLITCLSMGTMMLAVIVLLCQDRLYQRRQQRQEADRRTRETTLRQAIAEIDQVATIAWNGGDTEARV